MAITNCKCNYDILTTQNKNELYEVYNVGSGFLFQISDVAQKIFKIFGKSLSFSYILIKYASRLCGVFLSLY